MLLAIKNILAIILSVVSVFAAQRNSKTPELYARYAIVFDYTEEGVVLYDDTENIWSVFPDEVKFVNDELVYVIDGEEFKKGDDVTMIMKTCGTFSYYYDDEPVHIERGRNSLGLLIAYPNYKDFENLYLSEK